MKPVFACSTVMCVALAAVATTTAVGQSYFDGFEAPFWTFTEQSGAVRESTKRPHTDSRSAEFVSTNTGQDKWIYMTHDFDEPQYGHVSVWVYDTGADVSSSNYIWLTIQDTTAGVGASVTAFDYDLGPGQGGDVYYYTPWNGTEPIRSPIDRTQAWHLWEIGTAPDLSWIAIDGQTIYENSQGLPFDRVRLGMSGPSWRPAWTAYFDDFAIDTVDESYFDGFEAPFWTLTEQSGAVRESTKRPHEGSRSAEFVSTNTGQDKWIYMTHDFDEPQYGRVSVWMYDTGADVSSSNYLWLTLYNTAEGMIADVLTFDYDLGPGQGGDVYYYRPWNTNAQPIRSSIDRTQAWHLWEIETAPDLFSIAIDGQIVYESSQGMPFNRVRLGMSGPSWRPAWTAYFDDFFLDAYVETGDLDCDGAVDFNDINPFVLALSDPAAYAAMYPDCDILAGDCDADGDVDFDDINAFVALLSR